MAEYIKRETAVRAVMAAKWVDGSDGAMAMEIVMTTPAADVAPVVRCGGCEYAERYERLDGESGYYCGHPQSNFTYGDRWDRIYKPVKEANDFCSYGERKGGGSVKER